MTGSQTYERLLVLKDTNYKEFNTKLIPGVDTDSVIGVRTPALRSLAREMFRMGPEEYNEFLSELPHQYFEQNQLQGFIIEQLKDSDEVIRRLNDYLPLVNNWASCDQCTPKVFSKSIKNGGYNHIYNQFKKWIDEGLKLNQTYKVRFGIRMFMCFFLDENFKPEVLDIVSGIRSEEYYINMMISWFMATALCKQWDHAIQYIKKEILGDWVFNKSIQKACESFIPTAEQKNFLRQLKLK